MTFDTNDLKQVLSERLARLHTPTEIEGEVREQGARILALTMVGEARGESLDGRVAVGWTVRNRVMARGQTYASRCLQKSQYSCWWEFGGKENYDKLIELSRQVFTVSAAHPWFPVYRECLVLARGVISGDLRDRTKGSTHYLTLALLHSKPPNWVPPGTPTAVLGNHAFFADIPWS